MDFSYASALMSFETFSLNIVVSNLHFEPCFLDVLERDLVIGVFLHRRVRDHYPPPIEILQPAHDHVKPANGPGRLDPHQAPDELRVIRVAIKLAVQPGRRDLQLVLPRDRILYIEVRADLLRHELAIVQRDAALLVDVDAEEIPTTLLLVLDMHELQALGSDDLVDLTLNRSWNPAHVSPSNKKSGRNRPLSILVLLESRRIVPPSYGAYNTLETRAIPGLERQAGGGGKAEWRRVGKAEC